MSAVPSGKGVSALTQTRGQFGGQSLMTYELAVPDERSPKDQSVPRVTHQLFIQTYLSIYLYLFQSLVGSIPIH